MRGFRSALIASAAVVCTVAAQPAQAQTRRFNVPSQEISRAIPELARQAGVQIVAPADGLENVRSRAVRGTMDVRAALRKMLEGTGLVIASDSGGVILLRVQAARTSGSDQSLASTAESSQSSGDSEIVVTGSRLRGSGRNDGPAPITVLDRARIEQTGVTNVADALGYLPQQSFSTVEAFNFGATRYAQLRGLPLGSTLLLINGRRAGPSARNAASDAFNLNTIPLSMVDRIEVVTNSASAIYGADAIAGAVNVILKDRIDRPEVQTYFGTANGGGEEYRASFAAGQSVGNFRASVAFDVSHRSYLFAGERDFLADQDYRRFGGVDGRVRTTNPGNISSNSTANLPGLPSTFAAVPAGSTGVGLTPASFLPTAGVRNLDSTQRFSAIIPEMDQLGGFVTAEWDVTDGLQLYTNLFYVEQSSKRSAGPIPLSNVLVPASNAFNPFGVPVRADFLLTGLGPRVDQYDNNTLRIEAGGKGRIGAWDWDFSYLRVTGRDEDITSITLDTPALNQALASSNPAAALNVFQDGPGGTAGLLNSLLAPVSRAEYSIQSSQVSGVVRGPLVRIPSGSIELAVGGEARWDNLDFQTTISAAKSREWSAFAEASIPLFAFDAAGRREPRLLINLAGRYDHYAQFGGTFNPAVGARLYITDSFLIRGTWSTSFRAPSLYQNNAPVRTTLNVPFVDPFRNNIQSLITAISGGNPNLKPEEARAWTAGFQFAPRMFASPRVNVTYWAIRQNPRIIIPDRALQVQNESFFSDRVIRGPQTPSDIAAGIPGQIISINTTFLNAGELRTSGIDATLSLNQPVGSGSIAADFSLTWIEKYKGAVLPIAPVLERVGIADINGTIPEWRATGTIGYSTDRWGLSSNFRYISGYRDTTRTGVATGTSVSSQFYVDAQIHSRFRLRGIAPLPENVRLSVGVRNIFNDGPNYSQIGLGGYDPSQVDLRGRFGYVQLTTEF